jgi:type IV secretion system protein VirB1
MDFASLSVECAPWVATQTMAAIVRTESQFNPLAININSKFRLERQPLTKDEAVLTAKWLLANNYNIDMGLGQVNSTNMRKTNLSVEDAFDPCKNIAAAAKILQWNYMSASKGALSEQHALRAALSAYNTGSYSRGLTNGYAFDLVMDMTAIVQFVVKMVKDVAHQVKAEYADAVAAVKRAEEVQQLVTTYDQIVEAYTHLSKYKND